MRPFEPGDQGRKGGFRYGEEGGLLVAGGCKGAKWPYGEMRGGLLCSSRPRASMSLWDRASLQAVKSGVLFWFIVEQHSAAPKKHKEGWGSFHCKPFDFQGIIFLEGREVHAGQPALPDNQEEEGPLPDRSRHRVTGLRARTLEVLLSGSGPPDGGGWNRLSLLLTKRGESC